MAAGSGAVEATLTSALSRPRRAADGSCSSPDTRLTRAPSCSHSITTRPLQQREQSPHSHTAAHTRSPPGPCSCGNNHHTVTQLLTLDHHPAPAAAGTITTQSPSCSHSITTRPLQQREQSPHSHPAAHTRSPPGPCSSGNNHHTVTQLVTLDHHPAAAAGTITTVTQLVTLDHHPAPAAAGTITTQSPSWSHSITTRPLQQREQSPPQSPQSPSCHPAHTRSPPGPCSSGNNHHSHPAGHTRSPPGPCSSGNNHHTVTQLVTSITTRPLQQREQSPQSPSCSHSHHPAPAAAGTITHSHSAGHHPAPAAAGTITTQSPSCSHSITTRPLQLREQSPHSHPAGHTRSPPGPCSSGNNHHTVTQLVTLDHHPAPAAAGTITTVTQSHQLQQREQSPHSHSWSHSITTRPLQQREQSPQSLSWSHSITTRPLQQREQSPHSHPAAHTRSPPGPCSSGNNHHSHPAGHTRSPPGPCSSGNNHHTVTQLVTLDHHPAPAAAGTITTQSLSWSHSITTRPLQQREQSPQSPSWSHSITTRPLQQREQSPHSHPAAHTRSPPGPCSSGNNHHSHSAHTRSPPGPCSSGNNHHSHSAAHTRSPPGPCSSGNNHHTVTQLVTLDHHPAPAAAGTITTQSLSWSHSITTRPLQQREQSPHSHSAGHTRSPPGPCSSGNNHHSHPAAHSITTRPLQQREQSHTVTQLVTLDHHPAPAAAGTITTQSPSWSHSITTRPLQQREQSPHSHSAGHTRSPPGPCSSGNNHHTVTQLVTLDHHPAPAAAGTITTQSLSWSHSITTRPLQQREQSPHSHSAGHTRSPPGPCSSGNNHHTVTQPLLTLDHHPAPAAAGTITTTVTQLVTLDHHPAPAAAGTITTQSPSWSHSITTRPLQQREQSPPQSLSWSHSITTRPLQQREQSPQSLSWSHSITTRPLQQREQSPHSHPSAHTRSPPGPCSSGNNHHSHPAGHTRSPPGPCSSGNNHHSHPAGHTRSPPGPCSSGNNHHTVTQLVTLDHHPAPAAAGTITTQSPSWSHSITTRPLQQREQSPQSPSWSHSITTRPLQQREQSPQSPSWSHSITTRPLQQREQSPHSHSAGHTRSPPGPCSSGNNHHTVTQLLTLDHHPAPAAAGTITTESLSWSHSITTRPLQQREQSPQSPSWSHSITTRPLQQREQSPHSHPAARTRAPPAPCSGTVPLTRRVCPAAVQPLTRRSARCTHRSFDSQCVQQLYSL